MRAVLEVDFVTDVRSQANQSVEPIDAGARIDRGRGIARRNVTQAALESGRSLLIGSAEVDQAWFEGSEHPERAATALDLRAK